MDLEIVQIHDGEIEYMLNGFHHAVEYWLDFSHSEGEQTLDPTKYTYMEYYELEFGDEVLVETERYKKFEPSTKLYQTLRNAVQNKNYHIQVL